MARNIFKGLGVALITPFTSDGNVDYKSLTRLVEYQIDNGADFLCILATTSEAPCLSAEEKEKVKQLVIEVNRGRLPLLMGCGGNNTKAIVEELKNSDWRGIDGVLSVCPYLMNEAASYLLTVKDFGSFCKAHSDVKTTLCDVSEAVWVRDGENAWHFRISANRFLRNMVRAVVGTLIEVGRHRLTLEQFREVVASGNRSSAGESMPGNALFLEDVKY